MFYGYNILHMWQGQFVSIEGLLFYLEDLILKNVMCVKF
jgi:hypothetical protein